MESSRTTARGDQKPSPTAPVQQDFLFVDASKAKSSRQGRRNARSFVMQKARRERPWSTSKHAAKQRKVTHSTSPAPVRTPDLSHTPITSTPSPPIVTNGPGYLPHVEPVLFSRVKREICYECQFFSCLPGQTLCQRCFLLNSPRPGDIDNRLFDPFCTVSIELDASSSRLLDHCKFSIPVQLNEILLADTNVRRAELCFLKLCGTIPAQIVIQESTPSSRALLSGYGFMSD